jgi:hypothetical protein
MSDEILLIPEKFVEGFFGNTTDTGQVIHGYISEPMAEKLLRSNLKNFSGLHVAIYFGDAKIETLGTWETIIV